MIQIEIPGSARIKARFLVCDYNGTLATDGALIPGVYDLLKSLEKKIEIHILTADTFGEVRENLKGIDCHLTIIKTGDEQNQKAELVKKLGQKLVIAIGNGLNDALLLKNAALGIVVMQEEGTAVKTLQNADIACNDILDALNLVKNPLRIAATLRK